MVVGTSRRMLSGLLRCHPPVYVPPGQGLDPESANGCTIEVCNGDAKIDKNYNLLIFNIIFVLAKMGLMPKLPFL